MNRNDFINMIEDTVQVNRQMIGEVYELIDIFPYFQSAHMLLLKGLKNNADVKFENQLRISAIHIGNREVLYYLLKAKPSTDNVSHKRKQEKASSVNFESDTQQTVIESAKNSEYLISDIEKDSEVAKSLEKHETDIQAPDHSILISTETDNEDNFGVILLLDEDTSAAEESVFYMDPGFSVPDYNDLLELDLEEDRTIISDKVAYYEDQLDNDKENLKKQVQSELIDKFIIANPRIEPVKDKSNLSVGDISKPSVEERGGFVTETLARIYFNQGYYSKAIDIYEKLSLKFPEKSSYFASQIDKVKEYINK